MKSLIFYISLVILLAFKVKAEGASIVYGECSTNPWQDNLRQLWTRSDNFKLYLTQVKRVINHYEHPWSKEFTDYESFGENGWYYIGCTGSNQIFYSPVEWNVVEGCAKTISYESSDNEVFYATIIRAKKEDGCAKDEITKYWYGHGWHDIPEGHSIVYGECSTNPWQDDLRQLWTRSNNFKLYLTQVKRVNNRYEHPWDKEFTDYESFGDNGWYYVGCTGSQQTFYSPVVWNENAGCFKKISYNSPENEVFTAEIIRAKREDGCAKDEVARYWYDDQWHDIPEGHSKVFGECSTNPWQDNLRQLWTRSDNFKLYLTQVKRVNNHYEHPWSQEFTDYESFGENGWYYIGCTGSNQIFYSPVEWWNNEGCFKQISYTSSENEVFYADIIRTSKDGCGQGEIMKYWYNDQWNEKGRLKPKEKVIEQPASTSEIEQPTLHDESETTTIEKTATLISTTTTTETPTSTPTTTTNVDDLDADSFGTSIRNMNSISFYLYLTFTLCLLLIF